MRRGRFFWFLLLFFTVFMGFIEGREFVTKKEAFKIAKNYKMIAENNFFKNWKDANISKLTPFYSLNGDLVGYEVSFKKHGDLFISAKSDIPLIPFASEKGYSMSEQLENIYNNFKKRFERENIKIKDIKYLISLPDCYAIAVKINDESLNSLDIEGFKKIGEWFIYSPINECKNAEYIFKIQKSKKRDLQIRKNQKLKKIFLDTNASLKYKNSLNFKKISFKDKRYISSKELSDFYQERRNWSNGYCFAGCTPVAWAILLEYWDRHGFPRMVGSANDNDNRVVWDSDVVYMIDRLRFFMDTYCNSDGQGTTYREFVQRGIDYVYERGYKESYVERIQSSIWRTIKYEILQNRPLLADINLNTGGHSVVVYEFIENYENLDFEICVKTGWRDSPEKCYDVSYINQVHIFIPQGEGLQEQPPVAKIKASRNEIYENEIIYLDASQSYDPDGYITSYVWSLNGKIVGYGKKISFKPPSIGRLKIVLIVYDNSGMESRDEFILNVISHHINPTPTPAPRKGRMIVSALNGYCIDIAGANTSRGASLISWPCHGGSNQRWIYEDGMIKSQLNGYCIDIARASTSPGAKLISWPCHGGRNQRWVYENGMIKSQLNGYCIDIARANTSRGAPLIAWPCHGGSNQRWYIK